VGQLTIFGAVLALFGMAQRALMGASDFLLYGFWKPEGLATPFGPFINRNHFAGWMVMLMPLVIASASAHVHTARGPFQTGWRAWLRWLVTPDASSFVFRAIAVLVMATSLVLSGSRSGLLSLVASLAVLAWAGWRRPAPAARRALPALYAAVVIVLAVGWAGVGRTAARFENASAELAERAAAWRDTVAIITDFPVAGTGVGGYGSAMLVYQTASRQSIYVQAHNEYLQILAEGGALLAVPLLVMAIVIARTVRHRFRTEERRSVRWARGGALAGLVGIAAQSTLEFSLQMPGNAVMFVFLLSVALHRPSQQAHAHRV
jgi:O-antigen ligase